MKRLGIFYFYDTEGVIDRYVEYLLEDILRNVTDLVIVYNGNLSVDSRHKFLAYTNDVIQLKKIGFYSDAYKHIIENHIGYNNMKEWDELLLLNNSFYGPLYPFKEVFDKMSISEADFWGLINQGEIKKYNIEKHIQTHFLVIRKKMLHSIDFVNFWNSMKITNTIHDLTCEFDIKFTKHFEECGYLSDVLFDAVKQEADFSAIDWSITKAYDLVKFCRYPVIKKDALIKQKDLNLNGKDLINYLKNSLQYDIDMIYDNLLRTRNIAEIIEGLSLHYILSSDYAPEVKHKEKVAVFIHLYYEDLVLECFEYIREIPEYIDVYITTSKSDTYEKILSMSMDRSNIKKILFMPNRGRDVAALLVGVKEFLSNYDYFCFVHDKKSQKNYEILVGDIFRKTLWDNTLMNTYYVDNIINLFNTNNKLGLLVPPVVMSEHYLYLLGLDAWGSNYKNTFYLAKKLGIQTKYIDNGFNPISIGTAFWCKTQALHDLINFTFSFETFPTEPLANDGTISHAIERILPYVAQHNGYLTAVIECNKFAEKRLVFLNQSLKKEKMQKFSSILENLSKKLPYYVYGCGSYGQKIITLLEYYCFNISGCIVTTKAEEQEKFLGYPVYSLDEINKDDSIEIILAVNKNNTIEVEKELIKRGIFNYIKID